MNARTNALISIVWCASLEKYTSTLFFPNTCKSFCGFQSESKMITVSAAVKLIPRPPALVQRRKTKRSESSRENRSMAACRSGPRTLPSILSNICLHKSIRLIPHWCKHYPGGLLTVSAQGNLPKCPDIGPFGKRSKLYGRLLSVSEAACQSRPIYH